MVIIAKTSQNKIINHSVFRGGGGRGELETRVIILQQNTKHLPTGLINK
jgi:hypothetical protein